MSWKEESATTWGVNKEDVVEKMRQEIEPHLNHGATGAFYGDLERPFDYVECDKCGLYWRWSQWGESGLKSRRR